ncbi:MAG: type I glutamate--ammonia ligase [Candidatus Aenigmatarchaeota archaeon]
MDEKELLDRIEADNVKYICLMFTDILGTNKSVEIPKNQIKKALNGEIAFDGSSIEGFVRIEESDMLLKPDLDTYVVFPFNKENSKSKVARLICDVHLPNGDKFSGCPRTALENFVDKINRKYGYIMKAGTEIEFFLFKKDQNENITTNIHDNASYFDMEPINRGSNVLHNIVEVLDSMGFEVEAAHHEVAPSQYEIDFKYADAVKTADKIITLKYIVKKIADKEGLYATFMPKPIFGVNGSGMHTHQSLWKDGKNLFFDPEKEDQLSNLALYYIGGLIKHAKGITAITNPIVNSYKRLVPGYEAPTNIAWGKRNRSPLIRIPEKRGNSTRIEYRSPDPSCNPYLALLVMLAAGIDGIENEYHPGPPIASNVYHMDESEKRIFGVEKLPADLNEALTYLKNDEVIKEALGKHIVSKFIEAKEKEWNEYISQIHDWEIKRYL